MEKVSLNDRKVITNYRIAIIAFPWQSYAPYKFLSQIIKILDPISDTLYIISGNTDRIKIPENSKINIIDIEIGVHYLNEIKPKIYSVILWIIKCIAIQLFTSYNLIKNRKKIDVILFYMAYPYYFIPLVIAKILGIGTIEIVTRSPLKTGFLKIFVIIDALFFSLLDVISFESESLKKKFSIDRYTKKIGPSGARYIDASVFRPNTSVNNRKENIGYIGRLTEQKGIINFMNAIPMIAQLDNRVTFYIIGDGDLFDWVKEKEIDLYQNFGIKIQVLGVVKEGINIYLDIMKIIVIPSMSEGLPTILLEAMACGTVVLTTDVGAVREVIHENETGFFLMDNRPETIAKRCNEILLRDDLEMISKKAAEKILNDYHYSSAVERYQQIIQMALINSTKSNKYE
jgi:glycosyltransferase involved in cell wall biosynthesis